MAVKYGKFEMPSRIVVDEDTATTRFARLIAEPFERGFGHTIGNAMRRIMLTSLEAPAIVSFRIEGVPHEYMSVEGIIEDMTNIILNVKGALLRKLPTEEDEGDRELRLITTPLDITQEDLDASKGQVSVKLGDLVDGSYFDVVNPDLHLFSVTKPMKRQVDIKVAFGRGYVPSERHVIAERIVDEIVVDSAFSPVRVVNYFVENTRVGQDTDFDRLVIEVTTDGRVTPVEAVSFASQIAIRHFEVFARIRSHSLLFEESLSDSDRDLDEMMDKLCLRIDEIELSVRSANCLAGANIETIAELVCIPERRMLEFRNFGKKSLNEIRAKLSEMDLHLGMELNRYGINSDNAKQKVFEYLEKRKEQREFAGLEE